ncbi:AsnC family protein, partial [Mesorhizobium sp. M5C.F.Ca.IN.020.32.2.1]
MKLDKIDIKILSELQKNGRISNVELAELVYLS